jgi:hypothetical protein
MNQRVHKDTVIKHIKAPLLFNGVPTLLQLMTNAFS